MTEVFPLVTKPPLLTTRVAVGTVPTPPRTSDEVPKSNVPPLLTVMVRVAVVLPRTAAPKPAVSVPPLTVTLPVKLLKLPSVSVPVPTLIRLPPPLKEPL